MSDSTTPFNAAEWLVDRHVREGNGDRVALRCEGHDTTYSELLDLIEQAQRGLVQLDVNPGERVAMVMVDDPSFVAVFLGCLRSAVVPVPLSTMLRGEALGDIIADSGAKALFASAQFAPSIDTIVDAAPELAHVVLAPSLDETAMAEVTDVAEQIDLWDLQGLGGVPIEGEASALGPALVAATTQDSPAFWLYSSGTTGTPKGVMHTHGNLPATVDTYASQVLQVTPDDRFLSIAKLFFAYGLGNSLTFPLAIGATAILDPRPPTPATTTALIDQEQATLFFASPGFVAAVLDAQPDPSIFASMRATVTAGESLPGPVQTRFTELTGRPVLDGIGSTELLHIFISNTLDEQTAGSSGRVVAGYAAELRNDDDEVVTDPDTPGYLHVRGPSAAVGYWQRPEADAAAFRDGWVRTGDVYTRSVDDTWTFLGRNNDMIKAGGIWVSPAEVESVLIEHPDVMEAAVVGARDDRGLEMTVAYVLPATGSIPDHDELEQHCRDRMAAFKRPRRIITVDELPKTATGKIRRFELRDRFEQES